MAHNIYIYIYFWNRVGVQRTNQWTADDRGEFCMFLCLNMFMKWNWTDGPDCCI